MDQKKKYTQKNKFMKRMIDLREGTKNEVGNIRRAAIQQYVKYDQALGELIKKLGLEFVATFNPAGHTDDEEEFNNDILNFYSDLDDISKKFLGKIDELYYQDEPENESDIHSEALFRDLNEASYDFEVEGLKAKYNK
jgi:hypothetical protein